MKCRDVMIPHVYRCRADDSVLHCATLMRDAKTGILAIVNDHDRLIGVLTDRDLALRVIAENLPAGTPVREVMSGEPLLTFDPEEDLRGLEKRMAQARKWRAIGVDSARRCVGIISLSDVAQFEDATQAGTLLRDVTQRETAQALA